MAKNIRIRSVTGPAIEEWIPALARLRIGVFREFPYLYDGNEDYERRYLQTYTKTDTSIAVLAIAGDEVVIAYMKPRAETLRKSLGARSVLRTRQID